MEMRDDEVGVDEVYIDCQCCHIEASKSAYREEPDETKRIEHRRVKADGALVKCRRPVEDFDGRGIGHQKAEERKHRAGVYRLPAHEHVMAPDEEAEHRDGDTRVGHKPVAKD